MGFFGRKRYNSRITCGNSVILRQVHGCVTCSGRLQSGALCESGAGLAHLIRRYRRRAKRRRRRCSRTMMKHSKARWLLGLATLGAALAFAGVAAASADYPDTTLGLSTTNGTISVNNGNFVGEANQNQADCTDYGLHEVTTGTLFTGNPSAGFSFTSTTPVGLVAVKGSEGYVLYDYRTGD